MRITSSLTYGVSEIPLTINMCASDDTHFKAANVTRTKLRGVYGCRSNIIRRNTAGKMSSITNVVSFRRFSVLAYPSWHLGLQNSLLRSRTGEWQTMQWRCLTNFGNASLTSLDISNPQTNRRQSVYKLRDNHVSAPCLQQSCCSRSGARRKV